VAGNLYVETNARIKGFMSKWKYRYLRKCGINSKTSVQTVTVQSSTLRVLTRVR
jgi:hypothetical protein